MSTDPAVPGEIEITTVSLFSERGTVNVTEHLVSGSIYESIYNPGIVAEFVINDTQSLASFLPLLGEERILIEFNTPSLETASFDLHINSMQMSSSNDNLKSRAYAIKAVSDHVKTHKTTFIQKSYNTNISNMIQDIVSNFLKVSKPLQMGQTRGIQKIIIPNKKPFQAIDMIRRRAVSSADKSSTFVFFENQFNMIFDTVESLMTKSDVGTRTFINSSTINTDIVPSRFRNIIAWHQDQQFATAQKLGGGGEMTQVKSFDLQKMLYTFKNIAPLKNLMRAADGILNPTNSSSFSQQYNKPGYHGLMPSDSNIPKTFIPEATPDQKGYSAELAQGKIMLHVNGDSTMTVGQMLQADIVNAVGTDEPDELNPYISGKYLITKLRHIIAPPTTKPRYTCAVEGIKGGFKNSVS